MHSNEKLKDSAEVLRRLSRVVEDPELLEGLCAIVAELVEALRPLSVVVAGSLARRRFVKGVSDVDLLVVVDRVRDEDRFHLRAVGSTDVEITVVGLDELVEAVRRGNQFYRECLDGVEVYGSLLPELRRRAGLQG